jgi:S-adenosylmethionine uptake transporter
MAGPLVVTGLSVVLLKDQVGPRRWAAVLVGFAAVLFMIRPGGGISSQGALLLLASVFFYALNMISTRIIGRTESAGVMTFYANLVAMGVGGTTVAWVWTSPDALGWLLFGATGLIAGLAAYAMTQAFRIASPATLAPFEYTAMVWALVVGFVVWGELPSWSVLGAASVIVASGLYILHREGTNKR